MTESTLELSLLLPRAAECGGCVDEVGAELLRLDGIHAVETDVPRGLINVRFAEEALTAEAVETFARRAGAQAHCEDHCPVATHEHGPLDLLLPLPGERDDERRILHVTGMDCADCAVKLQGALRKERGVRSADVNFGAATLAVAIDPAQTAISDVFRAVRRLGYDTVERRARDAKPNARAGVAGASRAGRGFWLTEPRAIAALVSGAFTASGFVATAAAPAAAPWLFGAAVVSGGFYVARAAVFSLRARQVDMNVLMTLAMIGAAAIGQWSEAALVAFLFSLGTVLQVATLERTRRAISGLMQLAPPTAMVLRPADGNGGGSMSEASVAVADIAAGDVVVVRPGERAAIDGIVVEGTAAADQAPVTGESIPVAKGPGDHVFAGSIIEGGSLHVRATAAASDTTIAKIVHMVEEAQAQRAPAETIVDRFASRYTPVVVALAAAVAFIPPLLGASFDTWFYRGLALLIISCPCALVISTPVSILAALARATRNGVLIKGGAYLEQMAGLRAVAFDKTGTLTRGRPTVTDVVPLNGASAARVLSIAVALERYSEHPLARAIADHAEAAGVTDGGGGPAADTAGVPGAPSLVEAACSCSTPGCCSTPEPAGRHDRDWEESGVNRRDSAHGHLSGPHGPDIERFRAIPGRGVRAELSGRLHFVGRPDLLGSHAADAGVTDAVERFERQGKTAVVVGDENGALGVIAVSDPLRAGAGEVVAELRALGIGEVAMLTGDNPETAAAVAAEAGVTDVRAGLLPEQKVAAVAELRDRAGAVAMIGDGVNDAPALAAATLGIAMGAAGTDAALETADIALMGDDLAAVPETIRLARRTTRVIWQNIVFSIAVKAVFLVLAPLGLVSLWLAVFADMGTSLIVTANGLRLYRR